jgi:hypothetical protein
MTLRAKLDALASAFADDVVSAIRGASLQELLGTPAAKSRPLGGGRAPKAAPPKAKASGRLPRRSAGDIAAALSDVVALVKKHKNGLRAEEIRVNLALQAKELPRILKEGLSAKKLSKKGRKRATVYFAR